MMRVLLPIDNNEDRAIAAAETVISLPNASDTVQITLLHVFEQIDVADGYKKINAVGGEGESIDPSALEKWDLPSSVTAAQETLENAGISAEIRRELGDPAKKIPEIGEDTGVKRIIMAGRKRTAVGKVLFGSVTQSVMLNTDIPVTVIMT